MSSTTLKRELIKRNLQPGASVSGIALDSGINANRFADAGGRHGAVAIATVAITAKVARQHRQHRDRHRPSARQAARGDRELDFEGSMAAM
jgi:transposase-like protein